MSKIVNSSFEMSCAYLSQAIEDDKKEICFIGRSNVGKSSLINMLTNKKKLAKKSSTPGKTRLINFFDIDFQNEEKERFSCRFVDLPGLGYAKVSKEMKKDWGFHIKEFIEKRKNIVVYVYLVDSRHRDLDIDKNSLDYFRSIKQDNQHILKVFTKSDKITKNQKRSIKLKNNKDILVSSFDKDSINELSAKVYDLTFLND